MKKAAIVGGGFYGTCLAIFLHEGGFDVRIFEKESAILQRASSINQARIHMGYHYPRNLQTAYRSFVNFPRFAIDFRKTVVDDFTQLYAVAKTGSKVSAAQFHTTFKRMNAEIKPARAQHRSLFSKNFIEDVFEVKEFAFDSKALQQILEEKLHNRAIHTDLGTEIAEIKSRDGGGFRLCGATGEEIYQADLVFNCTYSRINMLRQQSGLSLLPFKHELTEMALVEVPDIMQLIGVTVMDGPYFSVMPYPSRQLHSFSHVRYTPHRRWIDADTLIDGDKLLDEAKRNSNFVYMLKDACRYMPILSEVIKRDSLCEIKTVLLQNERDDGRPILFHEEPSMPGCYTIMGGKIDNIYDILEVIVEARQRLGLKAVSISDLFRLSY
jgi:glycine/D-amino acid oxidase-like deaminating enzyme